MSAPTSVGESSNHVLPERAHMIDQPLIDRYAQVSGDFNPLHTDPEFARTTRFGRTIAHGMMTLAFLSEALSTWFGSDWRESGSLSVTFIAPVYAGERVVVRGELVQCSSGDRRCKLECWVDDRLTLSGEAVVGLREGPANG